MRQILCEDRFVLAAADNCDYNKRRNVDERDTGEEEGTDPEGVSEEVIQLLHYIETTSDMAAEESQSERIKEIHKRVCSIKSSEEMGVKYMQEWEERVYELAEARTEGRVEGRVEGRAAGKTEGEVIKLISQIRKKAAKHIPVEESAGMLEEDILTVQKIYDRIYSRPELEDSEIYEALFLEENQD